MNGTLLPSRSVSVTRSGSGSIIASVRDTASVRASMSGRVTASVSDTYGTQSSRKRGESRDVKQPRSFPVNEANRVDLYNALV